MKRELESRTTSHGGEVRLIWDGVSGRLDLEVLGADGELHGARIEQSAGDRRRGCIGGPADHRGVRANAQVRGR